MAGLVDVGVKTGSAIDRGAPDPGQAPVGHSTEEGLATARIPSVDKREIRVATEAVDQLFVDWNANSRLVDDPRYISDENTSIGFAPNEGVMYVWATKPEWDRNTREEWAEVAAGLACRTVLAESRAGQDWAYAQYAVAVLGGAGGTEFLRWGTAGGCAG
ncbi:hypothetical protein [Streptomyces sp. CS090A]|uniref:hypothetical protein n=1 Tax=Streptomyces sp. CS090A TaxID=2162710 RepID=UPI0013A58BC7|nr:hypothetical protein [Streptomyces sp. CS090A]